MRVTPNGVVMGRGVLVLAGVALLGALVGARWWQPARSAPDPRLAELEVRSTLRAPDALLASEAAAIPVLRAPAEVRAAAETGAQADSSAHVETSAQASATPTPTAVPSATPRPATPVPAQQPAGASLFVAAAADGSARYVDVPPTPAPTAAAPVEAEGAPPVARVAEAAITTELMQVDSAAAAPAAAAAPEDTAPEASAPEASAPEASVPEQAAAPAPAACPTASDRSYDTIPIASAPAAHPDAQHGDLNLALRGWEGTEAELGVVWIDGPADDDPPRLDGLFAAPRLPAFVSAALVYDWDWGCGAHGCRGALMTHREVTLLGLATSPGEAITPPDRGAQIYGGGYKALVLYADEGRVTLGYTRDDSVANGYSVHLEGLCVDPALVGAYRAANAAGRGALPALRDDELLGTAGGSLQVAVRDRGVFLDPRSRKDWWRGY